MSKNLGVWIDHRQAIIVLLADGEEAVAVIESGIEPLSRTTTGAHRKGDHVAEDTLDRKHVAELNRYFDDVANFLRDADAILLMGPGAAKGGLKKRIKSKTLLSRVADVETADKMTQRQVVAKVREHFGEAKPRAAVARRKPAVAKKVTVAVSKKQAPKKPAAKKPVTKKPNLKKSAAKK